MPPSTRLSAYSPTALQTFADNHFGPSCWPDEASFSLPRPRSKAKLRPVGTTSSKAPRCENLDLHTAPMTVVRRVSFLRKHRQGGPGEDFLPAVVESSQPGGADQVERLAHLWPRSDRRG